MSKVGKNVRELVRKGQQGTGGKLASSLTIEARVNGVVVKRMDLPLPDGDPAALFQFVQQAIGATAYAAQNISKKSLILGVLPNWKMWIIRKILRAV